MRFARRPTIAKTYLAVQSFDGFGPLFLHDVVLYDSLKVFDHGRKMKVHVRPSVSFDELKDCLWFENALERDMGGVN